ncbi:MAG: M48 family metalloprotease [Bdellovibrio sp.]
MVLRILVVFLVCSGAHANLLPMQPLFDAKTQDFLGMVINTRSSGNSDSMYISTIAIGPKQQQAVQQMQSLGLYTYIANGNVIGTRKAYSGVSFEKSMTVGLSIRFGSQSDNFLKIGSRTTYGLKIDWSRLSGGSLVDENGTWISDPITSIVQGGQVLSQKRTAMEVTADILQVAAVSSSLEDRRNSSDWPEMNFPALQQIKNQDLNLPQANQIEGRELPLPWQPLLREWQNQETTQREQRWQAFVGEINKNAPLWNNIEAQKYLQGICDRISAQGSVLPRCRIFASLKPYAFSYPGGDVFITTGFINSIKNEATLVFFLSHEIAHVYSRHFTKNLEKKDFVSAFMNTLSLVTAVLSIKPSAHPVNIQNLYAGMMTNYTKENELEADELAFEMCLALGYAKADIIDGLQSLEKSLENDFSFGKTAKGGILETRYPSWAERINRLSELSDDGKYHAAKLNEEQDSLRVFQKILKRPFEFFRLNSLADNMNSVN